MNRRYGKFTVTRQALLDLMRDDIDSTSLFGNFIIVKSELDFISDIVGYEAWSPLFDEIAEGEVIPLYTITIQTTQGFVVLEKATIP